MKVLITSGGTEEAIDGVRRISNTSTGRTGALLASYFAENGASVTLLRSEHAISANQAAPAAFKESVEERDKGRPLTEYTFLSYSSLKNLLHKQLTEQRWDAVVHLAAVSDYTVESVKVDGRDFPPGGPGKIGTGKDVLIQLKPTEKILDALREWSLNPSITVVGFKLTDGADEVEIQNQVKAQFSRGVVDFVVHNDIQNISSSLHSATIWSRNKRLWETHTKNEMAEKLFTVLAGEIR